MNELVRPTPKHMFFFAGLVGFGTVFVIYYSLPILDLNALLENLTFVVAISAGWATVLGDTIMFIEKYFEVKEENLRQKGRQSFADELKQRFSSTEKPSISKEDILRYIDEELKK